MTLKAFCEKYFIILSFKVTNTNQLESFETLEKQMNSRILELQETLATQQENDKSAKETVAEIRSMTQLYC